MIDDVADLADLAVGDRLARRGITAERQAMLVALDARILTDAATATAASVDRLARWLDAGQPAADLRRLAFEGDDSVLALVEDLIALVPPHAAWHAVEFVEWLEVGRGADGELTVARPVRAPAGDSAHRIKICGALTDERIRHVLPHELAHSMHRTVCEPSNYTVSSMRTLERVALQLHIAREMGIDEPESALADRRADSEYLAEATAQAWGFSRPPLHRERSRRRQGFIAELNAAAELVPDIERRAARAIGGTP